MTEFEEFKQRVLMDPEVALEYERQHVEFVVARALIQARIRAHMTQLQVAERMHTSQGQVARLESGDHFPSIKSIQKYAQAVNTKITIEICP